MSKKKFIRDYGFIIFIIPMFFAFRLIGSVVKDFPESSYMADFTKSFLGTLGLKFLSKYLIGNDSEKKKYLDLIQEAHFDRETCFNKLRKQKKEEDKFLDVKNDKEFQKLDREVLKNYLQFYKYYENKKICEELREKLENYECVGSEDLLEFIDEKIYF